MIASIGEIVGLCAVFSVVGAWSLWSVLIQRRAGLIALMVGACTAAVGAFAVTLWVAAGIGFERLDWIHAVLAFLPAILGCSTIVAWIAASRRPKVRAEPGDHVTGER